MGDALPSNVDEVVYLTSDREAFGGPTGDAVVLQRRQPDGGFATEPFTWRLDEDVVGYGSGIRFWIEPEAGFIEGEEYRFVGEGSRFHEGGPFDQAFTVVAPVTSLAPQVAVSEQVRGDEWFEGDGCEHSVDSATRTVTVSLPEVESFGEAVGYELLLDGEPWTHWWSTCDPPRYGDLGRSHREAVVPVACEEWRDLLAEGGHTVSVRTRLLGTDVVHVSSAETFMWSCDDEGDGEAEGPSGCAQGGGRAPVPLGLCLIGGIWVASIRTKRRREP